MSTSNMSTNWLEGMQNHAEETDRPMGMPVFAGQKLVVVGGSSGMGRQTAADVVAAGGSAVIIGQDPSRVDDTVQTLAEDGSAYGITADLADRMHVERVCQQLADEHADATLLVNAAGFSKAFLDYDGASYDSYLELDRAIFFLTQTVVRGMVEQGDGGAIVNIGSMWAHQAIAATPSSGYSVGKGGLHALTHNLAIELAPHQIRVNAVAPAVVATPIYEKFVPQGQARRDPAQLRQLPSARPGRHRPRPGQHHHVPALPGHQLGHRRHLECRRRRHGRTQLKSPASPCAGPTTRRTGRAPSTAGPENAGHNDPERTR
jgi:NAD(P)-dependent dehydrogenase (short-subunit alcohol dehydrogenase family)